MDISFSIAEVGTDIRIRININDAIFYSIQAFETEDEAQEYMNQLGLELS